jgi:hypothetical protein
MDRDFLIDLFVDFGPVNQFCTGAARRALFAG